MKIRSGLVALAILALVSYGAFAAYRLGLQQGHDEGATLALAVAEGVRYETTSEIGRTVGHPAAWDGLSREEFQDQMKDRSETHFAKLEAGFRHLNQWQRETATTMLWGSLSDEDERRLRQVPLP